MSNNIISTTEEIFQKMYMGETPITNNYYIDNLKQDNQNVEYRIESNKESVFVDSEIQEYFISSIANELENKEYINLNKINKLNIDIEINNRYKEALAKLEKYKNLPPQWDGYEAEVPKDYDIQNCIKFLNLIHESKLKIPMSMIASDGEISLFWEEKDNYMEIGFIDNKYSFYVDINNEEICSENYSIEEMDSSLLFKEIIKFD